MPQCFVSTCSNYYGKTRKNSQIIYHMLPTSPQMVSKWIEVCRVDDEIPTPHARVCSAHFSESCYQRDLQHELLGLPLRKKLKPDAIPDLNLPTNCIKLKKQVLKTASDNNLLQRKTTNGSRKSNENKNKATKRASNDAVLKSTAVKNQSIIPKKQNITIIDITTDQPIVNRKNVIKKLPSLTAVKSNLPIKPTLTNIKTKSEKTLTKTNHKQLSTLDLNKINNIKSVESKKRSKSTGEIIIIKRMTSIASKKVKVTENNVKTINKITNVKPENINSKVIKSESNVNEFARTAVASSNDNDNKNTTNSPDGDSQNKINDRSNDKIKKRPMRSSIRIAKKKSIESLSDSFTEKVNNKIQNRGKPENFSDKLKFMAMLKLKHEKNTFGVVDLDQFFKSMSNEKHVGLNKMQIMENVVEGCNVQPASPGHADERTDDVQVKIEPEAELDKSATKDVETLKNDDEDTPQNVKIEIVSNGLKDEPDSSENQDESYNKVSSPKADNKRKSESQNYPIKRLKTEIHENFTSRDKIINDFVEMADCTNIDQINSFSEQLLVEIKTLNEFAKEKEREWNNIIHLKKLKEELLLRMQRKKQILIINEKTDLGDLLHESQNGIEDRIKNASPQSILKTNLTSQNKTLYNTSSINGSLHQPKPMIHKAQNNIDLNGQGKRLTLDVQSIIADYRQRHPESVPRRGRRIRSSQNDTLNRNSNSIINFSSMALGSGAQVRQGDVTNDLGLLLNSINFNRQDTSKVPNFDSSGTQDSVSFKDMLLQFAKLSQNERNELIQNAIKPPPPYPEVTVHPVPTSTPPPQPPSQTNSLLHGILTKSPTKQNSKTSFSPTLARLLTAPERNASNISTLPTNALNNGSNMSISEILSTSKACNEITITPVDSQYESAQIKTKNTDEEETEDSADRLVIDENNDVETKKQTGSDNNSDGGDDVPLCQGCNQKSAQFVCAGCGNQWYCSRDCQVTAWDEHSEVCSG